MTLIMGSLLYNRYRIEEIIAEGGMGAIYRAYDQSLGTQVALKENLYSTAESSLQFRREATMLAGLRHPNLPRVTDHFSITGMGQYLVMDYVAGDDLRQLQAAHGLMREQEALRIAATVCEALQYLHTRVPPIIHRDIKLGNVKITPEGQVFLVDFGLAKIAAAGQATATGAQAYTPGYAPPEQYGRGTSPLSDIYSLGATLYAALSGTIPEDGLARAMGTATLTPLRTHRPEISERSARVIEQAMAIRAEDRFQTAESFRAALLNLPVERTPAPAMHAAEVNSDAATVLLNAPSAPSTNQLPTVVTPRAAIAAVPPAPRRSLARILIPLLILVIFGLASGAVFLARNQGSAPSPTLTPAATAAANNTATLPAAAAPAALPPTAPTTATAIPAATATATATALPATTTLSPTPTSTATLAATPLGGGSGQIAFASIREGKRPQIWLVNTSGTSPRALTDLADGACQPAWSPDGKRLVVVTPCGKSQEEYPGGTLLLINADGSNPEVLPSMPGGDFDPAWSPDGSQIAFTSLREGTAHIYHITLADRKVERLSGAYSDDRRPAWSPDGQRIAFESTRLGGKQIWMMGAKGENAAEFTRLSEGPAYHPAWSADGKILFYTREAGLPTIFARSTTAAQSPEARLTDLRPVQRPRVSSDGQWIAFESWTGGNHDITILRSTGTNRQQVTNDANLDFDPAWRP